MNLWSHRFSQNTNEKLSGFLPCVVRAEILTIFCSYFGRNDDLINSFWNCLTFSNVWEISFSNFEEFSQYLNFTNFRAILCQRCTGRTLNTWIHIQYNSLWVRAKREYIFLESLTIDSKNARQWFLLILLIKIWIDHSFLSF